MKNKLFTLLFALLASVGLLRAEVYSGTCGTNLTWSLNTIDSTLTISGTGAMNNYGYTSNKAPWRTYSEYVKYVIINEGVTSIGTYAIYGCGALISVTIPNSVTNIDNYAFCMCKGLAPVTIPDNVTNIGDAAFANCWGFTSIEIPCNVINIGSKAFYDCPGLTSVTFGNSVTSIGSSAFEGCRSLTSVTFSNSVLSIGSRAFLDCTRLVSVTIPSNVTNIGDAAFYKCTDLRHVINYNEVPLSITTNVFRLVNISSCTLYVPAESVEAYQAADIWKDFGTIQAIDEPILPRDTIWKDTLIVGCYGETFIDPITHLTNVILNDTMWQDTISYPWSMTDTIVTLHIHPFVTPALYYQDQIMVLPSVVSGEPIDTTFTIASLKQQFEDDATYMTAKVIDIKWQVLVTNNIWMDMPYIVPNNVSSVTLRYVVETECNDVLYSENLFFSVTPAPCTTLSGTCGENLTWELTCDSVLTISGTGDMTNYSEGNSHSPWYIHRNTIKSLIIEDGITSIGNYSFNDCNKIDSVSIPSSVTIIGMYAFMGCKAINTITIPNGVAQIQNGAFHACNGLTSVTIPSSVVNVNHPFSMCHNLSTINVANDNPKYCSIDGVLFSKDHKKLVQYPIGRSAESYIIPDSVQQIVIAAFAACSNLSSITIPQEVTNFGIRAFYNCTNLTSVVCQAINPPTLGDNVFELVNLPSCTLYVPAESVAAYQAANSWKDFGTILAIGEEVEPQYVTIADTYNMAQDSAFTLGAFDVVYVASFQNGANIYIKDESGYGVIYKPGYGLQAGDHVEAGLQGKANIYHGLYEVIPVSAKENLTITSGEAPAPMEATEAPTLNNVNQYVVYKNVTFDVDTAFVEGLRHLVIGLWNNQEIYFYNQYYIGATLQANKVYNIIAVNTVYGTVPQAYPVAVEEVSGEEPCTTLYGVCGDNLTWELTCDSVLTISGSGAMWGALPTWAPYKEQIKIAILPDGIDSIAPKAFYNCANITSVNMPNSVRALGTKAFVGCDRLTEPVYNEHIFGFMPRNYSGTYTVPEGIVSIAAYAFAACADLTEITLPSSVQRLGVNALGAIFLRKITCYAAVPPTCNANVFKCFFEETGVTIAVKTSIPVYVPAESVTAYQSADQWSEFFNILPIEEEPVEPDPTYINVNYLNQAGNLFAAEYVALHLPVAPIIEGFSFLKWQVVAGDLEDGIVIQAVYSANEPSSAPEVYTNPANHAQKLIRNGHVYILKDDKVYTIHGQKVK